MLPEEDFSRNGAKAQSAAAFLKVFFALLRLCGFAGEVFLQRYINQVWVLFRQMITLEKYLLIGCCFLALAGVAPADTSAQTNSINHPRMLISERDPLTGYNILRARYDAGARPP